MSPPTISIVTPSFNHGRYIEATIQSVLNQDYPGLEYLVVDGGSKDSTIETLRHFEHRLKWISEKDGGQADAINKGFGRTSGQVLGWVNSDDTLAPHALQTVGDFFAKNPDIGIMYGDADFIDGEGEFIGHCQHIEPFDRRRLLHYSDFIVQPAAFFRREVFEAVGGLDASLNWAMDYDFWLKASAKARVRIFAAGAGELSVAREQQDGGRRRGETQRGGEGREPIWGGGIAGLIFGWRR